MLSGETFAIGILSIKEIIEYGQLTEVPRMPASIRGVINLRGSVVPVIDLAARFGKKNSQVSRRTCIVIIEIHHSDEPKNGDQPGFISIRIGDSIGASQFNPVTSFAICSHT